MAKYQLEVDYDYDFDLIGISCHAKDYRLCWTLNKHFDFALAKPSKDLEIRQKNKGQVSQHSLFDFYQEEYHTVYTLVENQGEHGFLIPERKQANYFLLIRGAYEYSAQQMVEEMRKLDLILLAFELDVFALKTKQHLLF